MFLTHMTQSRQRTAVAFTAVICSLVLWYLLFAESLSYPVGAQDYGFPNTFKRVYPPDIVLFFPEALIFDCMVATLVVIATGYSLWHWSASWPMTLRVVFVVTLTGIAVFFFQGRVGTPAPLGLLVLLVMALVVPITWICSLAYASWIVGRHLLGVNRGLLIPVCLTVVLFGMGWRCWPHDIFKGHRNQIDIHALVEKLSDENPHVRCLALSALQRLDPYDEPTASAIIQAMSDSDMQVQSNAISLASQLGPSAVTAVPILRAQFLKHGGCTFELAQLGPIAKDAVPALEEKLPASEGYFRLGICKALWKIDGNATLVVTSLIELLNHDFGPIRVDAAALLGEIGPAARDSVSLLQEMVDHIPRAETPSPTDVKISPAVVRQMTEAEFYPRIRSAAEIALEKIMQGK